MKKIKVLMIGNHPSAKGGITSVISQLLEHDWIADGIDMTFIPTYIETNNIKKSVFFVTAYIKVLKRLLFQKPDIVHMHMSYKGSFRRKQMIHQLCQRFGVKDVIHLHGSEFQKWYNECDENLQRKIRTLLRESAAVIVLGEKWNQIVKEIEADTNTIVVGNTVHIPSVQVELGPEQKQILFLGVLIQRKGVSDLLDAVHLLVHSDKADCMHFVIAGSGEEESALKKKCSQLGIESYVTFAGWTDSEKKQELLSESQLLVLPSYNEGLPIAVLEAISYGMPVVATDVGDISAAVKDGENGFLVQPGDISALADRISKVFEDDEEYKKMCRASRELAEKHFSDAEYFAQIKQCYQDIGDKQG